MEILENFIPQKLNPNNTIILCGAGISMNAPTSLPTVYKFLEDIIRFCCEDSAAAAEIYNAVKTSNINYKSVSPRFEVLIEYIKNAFDENLEIANVFSSKTFNETHLFIAELLSLGASVITTNFDCCIENACEFNKIKYSKYIFTGQHHDLPKLPSLHKSIIKIHGSIEQSNRGLLVMTLSALSKTKNGFNGFSDWKNYFLKLCENKTALILGYSGSDDFDITPLLKEAKFRKCFWYSFNYSKEIPQSIPISNSNLKTDFKTVQNIDVVECNIGAFLNNYYKFTLFKDKNFFQPTLTVDNYLLKNFLGPSKKAELLNTILFHYDLHEKIVDKNPVSDLTFLQAVRSLYRLGRHEEICQMVKVKKYDIRLSNFEKKFQTELLHNYATSLYYTNNKNDSIKQVKRMRKIAKDINDKVSEMNSLVFLGAVNYIDWKHNVSKYYYREVLKLNHRYPYLDCEIKAKWGLGDIEFRNRNFDGALSYYHEALKVYSDMGNFYGIANAEHNIGMALYAKGEFGSAIERLLASKKIFTDFLTDGEKLSHDLIFVFYNLSKAYYRAFEIENAFLIISKAIIHLNKYQGHPHYHEIICLYYFLFYEINGVKMLIDKLVINRPNFNGIEVNIPTIEQEQAYKCYNLVNSIYSVQDEADVQKAMNLAYEFFNLNE